MKRKSICIILIMLAILPSMIAASPSKGLYRVEGPAHITMWAIKESYLETDGDIFIVTTVLKGNSLQKHLGVKEVSRKVAVKEKPTVPKKDIIKVEILDPDYELPSNIEIPRWSYEIYGNAALSMPVYVKADPINVVFELPSKSLIDFQLENMGWESTSSWNIFSANVNYVPYNGRMMPQIKNYFLDKKDDERYHLRIWRCGGIIVGQAHIDTKIPHKAYRYESAESNVIYAFHNHITRRNCIWLDNKCRDCNGYRCNGWASYITTYKYHRKY